MEMEKEFEKSFENEKLIDEHLKRLIGLNFY